MGTPKRVMRLADMTPAERRVVLALIEADRAAKGLPPLGEGPPKPPSEVDAVIAKAHRKAT
jgi:hypothetical protein